MSLGGGEGDFYFTSDNINDLTQHTQSNSTTDSATVHVWKEADKWKEEEVKIALLPKKM